MTVFWNTIHTLKNVYLGLNFKNPRENDESEKRGYFECEIGKDLVKPVRDCKVCCEIDVIQSLQTVGNIPVNPGLP